MNGLPAPLSRETAPQPHSLRSASVHDYLPIAEHGVISDQRNVALVGTDGTIDWYCPERFAA
jgi:hypothetical protein